MTEDDYISQRLDDQIRWFDQKSASNQRWQRIARITQIVVSGSIPVLVGYASGSTAIKILTGCLGVLVAMVTGATEIFGFHDNWLRYRRTVEALRHHRFLYMTGCAPYNGDDAFHLLVQTVEGILANENAAWEELQNKTSRKGESNGEAKGVH